MKTWPVPRADLISLPVIPPTRQDAQKAMDEAGKLGTLIEDARTLVRSLLVAGRADDIDLHYGILAVQSLGYVLDCMESLASAMVLETQLTHEPVRDRAGVNEHLTWCEGRRGIAQEAEAALDFAQSVAEKYQGSKVSASSKAHMKTVRTVLLELRKTTAQMTNGKPQPPAPTSH